MPAKKTEETKTRSKGRKPVSIKKVASQHRPAAHRAPAKTSEAVKAPQIIKPAVAVPAKEEAVTKAAGPSPVAPASEAVPAKPAVLAPIIPAVAVAKPDEGKPAVEPGHALHHPGVTAEIAPSTLAEKQSVIRSYLSGLEQAKSTPASQTASSSAPQNERRLMVPVGQPKVEPAPPMLKQSTKPAGRSLHLYRKISISFVLLTGLLLAVLAFFSFGKLHIKVTPKQDKISGNLPSVGIYPESGPAEAGGIAGLVRQASVTATKQAETTGKLESGGEVTGRAKLINNYEKSQPLVATTRLLSADGKLFRIKETVTVPANGSVEVDVYADEPKAEMAIGPSKFTIPGLWAGLQDKIYAESSQPMEYHDQGKRVVAQSDIDNAVEELKQSLAKEAESQLTPDEKNKYSQFLYQVDNNTIEVSADAKKDEEKDKVTVTVKADVAIIAFSDATIKELAKEKLVSYLGENKSLVKFNDEQLSYSLASVDQDANLATLAVSFEGEVMTKDESIIDRSKLVGLNKDQLESYLGSLPEVASFELSFSPSFITKAPKLASRITVEVVH